AARELGGLGSGRRRVPDPEPPVWSVQPGRRLAAWRGCDRRPDPRAEGSTGSGDFFRGGRARGGGGSRTKSESADGLRQECAPRTAARSLGAAVGGRPGPGKDRAARRAAAAQRG